jgi:hypothetical protein
MKNFEEAFGRNNSNITTKPWKKTSDPHNSNITIKTLRGNYSATTLVSEKLQLSATSN